MSDSDKKKKMTEEEYLGLLCGSMAEPAYKVSSSPTGEGMQRGKPRPTKAD